MQKLIWVTGGNPQLIIKLKRQRSTQMKKRCICASFLTPVSSWDEKESQWHSPLIPSAEKRDSTIQPIDCSDNLGLV